MLLGKTLGIQHRFPGQWYKNAGAVCANRVRDRQRLAVPWNHLYRVWVFQCDGSFCHNYLTGEYPSVRLKAIESKAVSCWNIPIKRSDPGLIFRNKQTSGKPRMASYSRRRQMWLLAGCTRLWCSSLARGCPRRGLLISATILGFWQLEFLPPG